MLCCGFVDLRPIEIKIFPDKPDTVLSNEKSPITIRFGTNMIKNEAEKIMSVSSDIGVIECDRSWDGRVLKLIPVSGWTAGIRYLLCINGYARSVDGREFQFDRNIYFYAINKNAPPLVESFSPYNGESINANKFNMEINFSQPMDNIYTEQALTINGISDIKYEWINNDKTLKIFSEKPLSPWTIYRWTIKTEAKSKDGVPLVKSFSGMFITDKDRVMPEVVDVYPAVQSNGQWFPTGDILEKGFGPSLGLIVNFNKPMEDEALRSLRFSPSISGRTEWLSDKKLVFIPNQDPEPQKEYLLIISGDAKDSEGIKIGTDYCRSFITDIPYLQILSISSDGENLDYSKVNDENINNLILPVKVSETDRGLVRISIHFSFLLDEEVKQKTTLAITLQSFFPGSLDPIALCFAFWPSDDRLIMEWERLSFGSSTEPHFYKLFIPGGRGGIENGNGLYLKKDICVYLEAKK